MKTARIALAMVGAFASLSCGMAPLSQEASRDGGESTPPPVAHVTPPPKAPEVKAGWADDNAQYNYYLNYLDRFAKVSAFKIDVTGRIVFAATDQQGRSLHNCQVTVSTPEGKVLCERKTYADGRAMFFPCELAGGACPGRLKVSARWGGQSADREFDIQGPGAIDLKLACDRPSVQQVPLDVVFVIDTTNSMSDEIAKLKQTLSAIHFQVTQMSPRPDARFGMVLYRDRDKDDEYRTRVTPLTGDIEAFTNKLNAVKAGGGGDEPEDVQEALRIAVSDLQWRPEAVKMVFLLGDAPPHLDYPDEKFTYRDYARRAAGMGIKTTTIGASGLNDQGEYVWRQLAQYTMGLYVFLTRGEKGESGSDAPGGGAVSHHTGANWVNRNLDTIIVQSIAGELSHLSDRPVEAQEDYFQARSGMGLENQAVLEKLYGECVRQLVDFSQVRLAEGTTAAVVPPAESDDCPAKLAGSMGDQLHLAFSRQDYLKLVDREHLKDLLDEMDLAKALDFDAKVTIKTGKPMRASVLVLAKVRKGPENYDLYVKMVRVQTGEVVSASMMKIDRKLMEAE